MSQSKYLKIYLTGKLYKFYYSYNANSTFDDLLESFSYYYPNLQICPCYKIKYNKKQNNNNNNIKHNNKNIFYINNNYNNNIIKQYAYDSYIEVNMKEKVYNYMSYFDEFQLIKNNKCTCDQLIKFCFLKPKLEIIKAINIYMKELEKLKEENNNIISEGNKLQQQVEKLKQQVSNLTNENNNLTNSYKKLQTDNYSLEYNMNEINNEIESKKRELEKKNNENIYLENEIESKKRELEKKKKKILI